MRVTRFACAAQHGFRKVDPDDAGLRREHRQFEPGADPDVDHPAAFGQSRPIGGCGAARRRRCRQAAGPHHGCEGDVVDRRPAGIGRHDLAGLADRGRAATSLPGRPFCRGGTRLVAVRHATAWLDVMNEDGDPSDAAGTVRQTVPPPSTRASSAIEP